MLGELIFFKENKQIKEEKQRRKVNHKKASVLWHNSCKRKLMLWTFTDIYTIISTSLLLINWKCILKNAVLSKKSLVVFSLVVSSFHLALALVWEQCNTEFWWMMRNSLSPKSVYITDEDKCHTSKVLTLLQLCNWLCASTVTRSPPLCTEAGSEVGVLRPQQCVGCCPRGIWVWLIAPGIN